MAKTNVEMEAVTIHLPKPIMEFLKAFVKNVEGYLENAVLDGIRMELETNLPKKEGMISRERLIEKFELQSILYDN